MYNFYEKENSNKKISLGSVGIEMRCFMILTHKTNTVVLKQQQRSANMKINHKEEPSKQKDYCKS